MKKLTHISFFSGIGGFEYGAEAAEIKNIAAVELDAWCCEQLRINFPEIKVYETDIKNIKSNKLPKADIYSAGFPCQDISINNKNAQGISGERSGMFFYFFELVRIRRPKYVILENSPILIRRGLDRILALFAEIGYDAQWFTLQGKWFGYPHKRERLFIITYPFSLRCKCLLFRPEKIAHLYKEEASEKTYLRIANSPIFTEGNYRILSGNNEFSREMKQRIKAYGNAVMPVCTRFVFECIKDFDIHK